MLTKSIWLLVAIVGISTARGAESPAATAALQAALAKNVSHAREWLDQKDYKSVAQSAGGTQLIAELTKAKSSDAAWQAALDQVLTKINELSSAARDENVAKCQSALVGLESAVGAIAKVQPTGQPQPLPKSPAIRTLMLAMDAMQADAKVAVLTGNVTAAKNQAHVLAELAKLVSNSRTTEQWTSLAGEFAAATSAAANSTDSDPKLVRQHFRAIAERCEACHENVRTK